MSPSLAHLSLFVKGVRLPNRVRQACYLRRVSPLQPVRRGVARHRLAHHDISISKGQSRPHLEFTDIDIERLDRNLNALNLPSHSMASSGYC
jgi:hypothetical protein